MERFGDENRYGAVEGFTKDERRRVVRALASHARSLAREGSRRFQEELSSFFDPLDFEPDLDYSPNDPREGPGKAGAPTRSPGELILPPS